MGIWSILEKDENAELISNVERELRSDRTSGAMEFLSRFMYLKTYPESRVIEPFELYASAVKVLMEKKTLGSDSYTVAMQYGEEIYSAMFPFGEKTADFEELCTIFLEMFDRDGVVFRKLFNASIYDLFNDKYNFMKWIRSIAGRPEAGFIDAYISPYATEARTYFLDEIPFTANLINVTKKLQVSADKQAVYDEELGKLRRMSGIYDVNEATLLEAVRKIQAAEVLHDRVSELVKVVEERVSILDATSRNSVLEVKSSCEDEVKKAKYELGIIDEKLKAAYDAAVNEQKKVVLYEKKKLLDDTFAEAEERLSQLKQAAEKTINTVKLEMPEGITEIKLDTKQTVATTNVQPSASVINVVKSTSKPSSSGYNDTISSAADYLNASTDYANIYEPQVAAEDNDVEIPDVNPLLDETRSFSERLEEAMKKKQYMVAMGEHFHKMFDDVLIAVMENSNPYLIGPSGCGKTFMVSQIARILGMDFIDIGYINEEYDILGFQTANGGYSRPNFYRCYKYGKIAFCDELDNGNSRATVKLNSFLSNLKDASYSFPNGENVRRHPNFRIIGAGNTDGNGADSNYNSREKIEESVQQRFTPIYIGYDNEVEKKILADYPDWYSFLVLFRMATDEWGRNNYGDAPGIITTRDATRIKKYRDNNSFDMEKILEYEFIQTKDITYLAFIEDHIKKNIAGYENASTIFNAFSSMINSRRG